MTKICLVCTDKNAVCLEHQGAESEMTFEESCKTPICEIDSPNISITFSVGNMRGTGCEEFHVEARISDDDEITGISQSLIEQQYVGDVWYLPTGKFIGVIHASEGKLRRCQNNDGSSL